MVMDTALCQLAEYAEPDARAPVNVVANWDCRTEWLREFGFADIGEVRNRGDKMYFLAMLNLINVNSVRCQAHALGLVKITLVV